jgi:transcriptional regulator with XRE-family HTH domain
MWLREQRKRQGKTQSELSLEAQVDMIHISRVENKKAGVSPQTVEKLAHALGLDVEDALLRAGFGRLSDHPDREIQQLLEPLSPEQRRIVIQMCKACATELMLQETGVSILPRTREKRRSETVAIPA